MRLIERESTLAGWCCRLEFLQLLQDALHRAVSTSRDQRCDVSYVVTSLWCCAITTNFSMQHTLTFENVSHPCVETTQVDRMLPVDSWDFNLAAL